MFGEKIKAFAKIRYGSVKELSSALGILSQQLSSYTSESRKPGYEMLEKLFLLGCDINWLIDDSKSVDDFLEVSKNKVFTKKVCNSEELTNEEIRALKSLLEKNKKTSSRNVG